MAEPLTAVLPERESGRLSINWTRGPIHPDSGVLEICGQKKATSYAVVSLPTEWPGRAFNLEKVAGEGTDATEAAYAVFCSTDPDREPDNCPCKGFSRWKRCKHIDALAQLIQNRWI